MRAWACILEVLLLLVLTSCGKAPEATTPGKVAEASKAQVAPAVPKVASLEVLDLAKLRARIKASGAKLTLVAMWATWCVPCIKEMPSLAAFYAAHRAEGLEVLGLGHDDRTEADMARKIQAVLDEVAVPYPQALLQPGQDEAFFKELGVEWDGGLPVTLVFDAQGSKLSYSREPMTEALLGSQVLPLLKAR
jgi:thiol-disulfide isomerase/thioredoxin